MVDIYYINMRLLIVGYTSCPAHTTEDVQKYADILDPG